MSDYIGNVMAALNAASIPAIRAYPGGVMAELTATCATVGYRQVDAEKTELVVTVLTPAAFGGSACEDAALEASAIMRKLGALCTQGGCTFDSRSNLFSVEVCAAFYVPEETAGFTVTLGDSVLKNVVDFTAWQSVDETVTALSSAPWHFRLEELFAPGAAEESGPTEPFRILVSRANSMEIYADCTWTSQKRMTDATGLHLIREGIAGS